MSPTEDLSSGVPTQTSLADLKQQGQEFIIQWNALEYSKTETLRNLARVVVEIRSQFHNEKTGLPDWRGSTWEYRQFIAKMYEDAGIAPARISGVQSSLRYHVGNQLRKVVPSDELKDAGLTEVSPKERMMEKHQEGVIARNLADLSAVSVSVDERRERFRKLMEAVEFASIRLRHVPVDELTDHEAADALEEADRSIAELMRVREMLSARVG